MLTHLDFLPRATYQGDHKLDNNFERGWGPRYRNVCSFDYLSGLGWPCYINVEAFQRRTTYQRGHKICGNFFAVSWISGVPRPGTPRYRHVGQVLCLQALKRNIFEIWSQGIVMRLKVEFENKKNFGCTLVTAWRRRMRRGQWSSRLANFFSRFANFPFRLFSSSFAADLLQGLLCSLEVLFLPSLVCWPLTSLSSLAGSHPWGLLLHILLKDGSESSLIACCCFRKKPFDKSQSFVWCLVDGWDRLTISRLSHFF